MLGLGHDTKRILENMAMCVLKLVHLGDTIMLGFTVKLGETWLF